MLEAIAICGMLVLSTPNAMTRCQRGSDLYATQTGGGKPKARERTSEASR